MAFTYGDSVPEAGAKTLQMYIKASTIQAFTATSTTGAGRPVKLTSADIQAANWDGTGADTLGDFTLIGVMEKGLILQTAKGDTIELNDDTVINRNRNITYEGTLLQVTDANLTQILGSFFNVPCDILLWDCSQAVAAGAPFSIAYGMRITIDVISENLGLYKCKFTATANEAYPNEVFVFDELT